MCEKKGFVFFCIIQQVEMTLDSAMKIWGGGVTLTLWSWLRMGPVIKSNWFLFLVMIAYLVTNM